MRVRAGKDVTIASTGLILGSAIGAAELLARDGIDAALLHFGTVKPLDEDAVLSALAETGLILALEEHSVLGGFGSAVAEVAAASGAGRVLRLGFPGQASYTRRARSFTGALRPGRCWCRWLGTGRARGEGGEMSWAKFIRRMAAGAVSGSPVPEFLDLGAAPFTDDFVTPESRARSSPTWLQVSICRECWTAQTQHDVEVDEYYRDYNYSVAASPFAQRFMARLAQETLGRRLDLEARARGGLGRRRSTRAVPALGARVLVLASAELCATSRAAGVPVAECLFEAGTVGAIPADMRPADVVLLTYTFDHLPDPLPFLEAVGTVLDPSHGVLVIEVYDLEEIMRRRETCLFEHEHLVCSEPAAVPPASSWPAANASSRNGAEGSRPVASTPSSRSTPR